jgi:hypothetical protein
MWWTTKCSTLRSAPRVRRTRGRAARPPGRIRPPPPAPAPRRDVRDPRRPGSSTKSGRGTARASENVLRLARRVEDSAQRLVARHQVLQGAAQRRRVEAAAQAEPDLLVVGARGVVADLRVHPDLPLRGGERERWSSPGAVGRGEELQVGRRGPAPPPPARGPGTLGEEAALAERVDALAERPHQPRRSPRRCGRWRGSRRAPPRRRSPAPAGGRRGGRRRGPAGSGRKWKIEAQWQDADAAPPPPRAPPERGDQPAGARVQLVVQRGPALLAGGVRTACAAAMATGCLQKVPAKKVWSAAG